MLLAFCYCYRRLQSAVLGANDTTEPATGRGEGSSETAGNDEDTASENPSPARDLIVRAHGAAGAAEAGRQARRQTSGGPMRPPPWGAVRRALEMGDRGGINTMAPSREGAVGGYLSTPLRSVYLDCYT